MKLLTTFFIAVLFVMPCFAQQYQYKKIVVLPFQLETQVADENSGNIDSQIITTLLADDLRMIGLLGRNTSYEVWQVFEDVGTTSDQLQDSSNLIDLADKLYADYLVYGFLSTDGNVIKLQTWLINGKTGLALVHLKNDIQRNEVLGATQPICNKICEILGVDFQGKEPVIAFSRQQAEHYINATKALSERNFITAIRELRSIEDEVARDHPYFQSLRESVTAANISQNIGTGNYRSITLLGDKAVPWLAPLVSNNSDKRIIRKVLGLLKDIGTTSAHRAILLATDNADEHIRITAYNYLADSIFARSAMLIATEDPSTEARVNAAWNLRLMPKVEAFEFLKVFASDPDMQVRQAAIRVTLHFPGVDADKLIAERLQDDSPSVIATAATYARSDTLGELLIPLLEVEDLFIKVNAAKTLSEAGNARAKKILTELLTVEDDVVASIAIQHVIEGDFDKKIKRIAVEQGIRDNRLLIPVSSLMKHDIEIDAQRLAKFIVSEGSMYSSTAVQIPLMIFRSKNRDAREFLHKLASGNVDLPKNKEQYRFGAAYVLATEGSRADVSKLFAEISKSKSPDPLVIEGIALSRNPSFLRIYKTLIKSTDNGLRSKAGIGIALATPNDIEALLDLVEDDYDVTYSRALPILEHQAPKRALVTTKSLISDPSKRRLLLLFARTATQRDVNALDPILKSRDRGHYHEMAWLVAAAFSYQDAVQMIDPLLAEWENDPEALGVWYVVRTVLKQGIDSIDILANDRRAYVRNAAMRLAQVTPDRDKPQILLNGLLDENAYVRLSANRAIAMYPTKSELKELGRWLDGDDSRRRNSAYAILMVIPHYRDIDLQVALNEVATPTGLEIRELLLQQRKRLEPSHNNPVGNYYPRLIEDQLFR